MANNKISPITIICMYDPILAKFITFPTTVIKKDPIITPGIFPSPPPTLVPPITAAAIACNIRPLPNTGSPAPTRAVNKMPVNPAKAPQKTYAKIVYFFELMPDSIAALSFPPIAQKYLPKCV